MWEIRCGLQWRVGCYPDRIPHADKQASRSLCFNGGSGVTPTEWRTNPKTAGPRYALQWRVGCYPDRMGAEREGTPAGACLQWRVGCYPDRMPSGE